jgi:hypothetical protein
MAIGEESKVTDAMEAVGQGVEKEAPDPMGRVAPPRPVLPLGALSARPGLS